MYFNHKAAVSDNSSMMRVLVIVLLRVNLVCAATHSLRYFYTGVSGDINFPEFTAVGLVDGGQFMYFDSNKMQAVPKADWIRQNEGADYWTRQTQSLSGSHQAFKNNIQVAMQQFNQSQGVHTIQLMYGCELDDETRAKNGFHQYGYDGEDFLTLDLKESRWISPVQQGFLSAQKWNNDRADLEYVRNYFNTECIEWLQKYVQYEKSTLEKTVSPQVSLLRKSSSFSVVCHATGFYPSGIKMSWMKNGQDHDEDVELGELLPNADGTFQKTSTLTVTPEEWKNNKYSCVVEHQGETTETQDMTRTNQEYSIGLIVGVIAAVLLLIVIVVAGYMVYHKKKGFKPAFSVVDDCSSEKSTNSLISSASISSTDSSSSYESEKHAYKRTDPS